MDDCSASDEWFELLLPSSPPPEVVSPLLFEDDFKFDDEDLKFDEKELFPLTDFDHSTPQLKPQTNINAAPTTAKKSLKPHRRTCSVVGCKNGIVQGGLCVSHGAKRRKCRFPGCTKNSKKAGLCSKHGPPRKKCEQPGCTNVAVKSGMCKSHGAQSSVCSVELCSNVAVIRGMCKRHHDQARAAMEAPKHVFPNAAPISGSSLEKPHDASVLMHQNRHHCSDLQFGSSQSGFKPVATEQSFCYPPMHVPSHFFTPSHAQYPSRALSNDLAMSQLVNVGNSDQYYFQEYRPSFTAGSTSY